MDDQKNQREEQSNDVGEESSSTVENLDINLSDDFINVEEKENIEDKENNVIESFSIIDEENSEFQQDSNDGIEDNHVIEKDCVDLVNDFIDIDDNKPENKAESLIFIEDQIKEKEIEKEIEKESKEFQQECSISEESNSDSNSENNSESGTENKEVTEEEKKINKRKKIIKWSIISVSSLLLIYLGISTYFMKHFYFGSSINSIPVSGKTIEQVNDQIAAEAEKYALILEGRDDAKDEISASEIGLKYNSQDKVKELKDSQNPFKWVTGLFNKSDMELSNMVSYDENLLNKAIDELTFFDESNVIQPKNAELKYVGNKYEIISEVNGNKVNKDVLQENILDAILKEKTVLSLEEINCYEKPQYTLDSKEIIEARDTLNKYLSLTINYTFESGKELLNGTTINTWLKVDENFNISFDEEKVKNYVDKLGTTYDTLGKPINFRTTSGRTVKVSSWYYGVSINRSKETQDLIRVIKEGKSIDKKPIYNGTERKDGENGIGNTYVEIDLTNQHLWFYKNGKLMAEGDVVTGNEDGTHSTPAGLYKITYKQKDAILRGPGYAAPVTYWMPFNGDIGIHDATWRATFGGSIYKNDGSHGCVNSPYDLAEAIFYNIEAGDPVICYH